MYAEVIGMVHDVGPLEPGSNGAKKMDVLLVDNMYLHTHTERIGHYAFK